MTRGARALVTGGAGFVGRHLVARLVAGGADVLVIDDLSSGEAAPSSRGVAFEKLDILDPAAARAIERWRPRVVYHLAAQVSVPRSMADPEHDLEVNVVGTRRMVEAARRGGVRRFVFVSSGGAVYGETRRAATEASPVAPRSFYGAHKLAAEMHVTLSGLSHAIARPSNLYGPGQRAGLDGAVVQAFLAQAADGGPLVIDGDGSQSRDFVHVADAVEALALLGATDASGTWNVARGRSITIASLAALIEAWLGPLGRRHREPRAGDVHASRMRADALLALGWRPAIGIRAGIGALVRELGLHP